MPITVSFQEHEDSPRESGNRSGQLSLSRVFLTAWADRWTFLRELFSDGPFGLPASYSSEWPGVVADTFQITRLVNAPNADTVSDPNTQQLTHDTLAVITVTYSPLDSEQQDSDPGEEQLPEGTFATYHQSQSVEFLSTPSRGLKWSSDNVLLPPDITAVLPQMLTQHTVTWHQVRDVPWKFLSSIKGKVNQTAVRLPGSRQTFQPGTLLFEGLDDETTLSFSDSSPSRKLELRFTEKSQPFLVTSTAGGADAGTVYGWNHQYRPDTQDYDEPVNAADGSPLFQVAEFNDVWSATE